MTELTAHTSGGNTAEPGSGFSVTLDFFSGPMDLLLHLVTQQEVPIEKVEMALVAEQYLKIVSECTAAETARGDGRFDIDVASEYLVIAATLLAIKSKSLLPLDTNEAAPETEESWEASRFFEDLRERLRAYELVKARALTLIQTPQLGVDTFNRVDRKALLPTPEMLAEPEDVYSLGMLFGRLLKRIGASLSSYRVWLEPVSVVSYMMKILDKFAMSPGNESAETIVPGKTMRFSDLLRSFVPRRSSKDSSSQSAQMHRGLVIGSFIATLELIKRGIVAASFSESSEDFELTCKLSAGGEALELQSEFDSAALEKLSPERTAGDEKVIHMAEYRQSQGAPASAKAAAEAAEDGDREELQSAKVRVANFERGS